MVLKQAFEITLSAREVTAIMFPNLPPGLFAPNPNALIMSFKKKMNFEQTKKIQRSYLKKHTLEMMVLRL
jgi:hypothetical protein